MVAKNRKARNDYQILDVFEGGLVLTGTEVKTLREGWASLVNGYASIDGGEVWLENVHIPEFFQGFWTNHFTRRKRKPLLNLIEIYRLSGIVRESGQTVVPRSPYLKDGRAKFEIAFARGKKNYDKRQTLKEAQHKREVCASLMTRDSFLGLGPLTVTRKYC